MKKQKTCGAAALQAKPCLHNPLALSIALASGLLWTQPSYAVLFGSEEGISGSFDSTLSYGFATRLQSPDCHLLGGDSGGAIPAPTTSLVGTTTCRVATAMRTPISTTAMPMTAT
ncbi:DUF1302 family protein [Pseudomonas aeruginosa]|nr:DUF1302 family protein [Pseudomonas aeruginosa]